jgi:hypothetical protein
VRVQCVGFSAPPAPICRSVALARLPARPFTIEAWRRIRRRPSPLTSHQSAGDKKIRQGNSPFCLLGALLFAQTFVSQTHKLCASVLNYKLVTIENWITVFINFWQIFTSN